MAQQFNGFLVTKTDGDYLDITAAELYKHISNGGLAFILSHSYDALNGHDYGCNLISNTTYNGRVYSFYYYTDGAWKYYAAVGGDEFPMLHEE